MERPPDADQVQSLIDTGTAWLLEGAVGRHAMSYITAGYCMLGEDGHRDYWGNWVPSRDQVVVGTKGSPEYCRDAMERERGLRP